MVKKFVLYLLYASIPVLILVGCSPGSRSNDLVVVQRGWPLGLTPGLHSEIVTHQVQYNVYEGLVEFDPQLAIRPLLAEYWENPNNLTWAFRLRPKVAFHDGRPVTAQDVVYSFLVSRDHPESVNRTDLAIIDTVYQATDSTVVIVTKQPCPLLLNRLVQTMVVPLGSLEGKSKGEFAAAPPGTGPYRFKSFPQGGPLVLERWQGYWGRQPEFDRMVYLSLMDQDQALRLAGDGRADIIPIWGSELSESWQDGMGGQARLDTIPGLMLVYLGLDVRRRPLYDGHVRRALSLAIDREALIAQAIRGFGCPANQLAPKAVCGYNPSLPALSGRPDSARSLLRQAGFPRGIDLTLTASDARSGLARALKLQMEKAGIRLELRILPRKEFYETVDTVAAYLLGLASTSGDVSEVYNYYLHTRTRDYGEYNRGGYSNPAVDRLIEAAATCLDEGQRTRLLQQVMALVMEDMPLVPLGIEDDIYAVSDRIEWSPRLDQLVLGKEVRSKKEKRELK